MNLATHDFTADIIAEDIPAVEVRNGDIFWRGVFCPREQAKRLRDQFANSNDAPWFKPTAERFVAELDAALTLTEH